MLTIATRHEKSLPQQRELTFQLYREESYFRLGDDRERGAIVIMFPPVKESKQNLDPVRGRSAIEHGGWTGHRVMPSKVFCQELRQL